ncbi:MAG: rhamnulokinase, partial [Leptolinea sp.]|nr:rhamnulokinase [Leptolinea sp.]
MDRKDGPPMYLAFDLGAESGRAILGCLENERLQLNEVYRFPNRPVEVGGTLHWDILRLWEEIKHGLELAFRETGGQLVSVGIDTWGVDFALLDA